MTNPSCKGNYTSETRCEYDSPYFCKNPDCKQPILTSTMAYAHPAGCPKIDLWNNKSHEEKGEKA